MFKQIVTFLVGVGVIFGTLFWINIISINNKTLTKEEARVALYQQDPQKRWIAYNRDSNDSNRTIKSVITFYKKGEIALHFSLEEDKEVESIKYTVKKGEKSYSLSLSGTKTATVTFLVYPKDKIEIITKKYGSKDRYWGTLKSSFWQYHITLDKLYTLIGLWVLLFLFLLFYHYIYLSMVSFLLFLSLFWAEKLQGTIIDIELLLGYTMFIFWITFVLIWLFELLYRFRRYRISFLLSWIVMMALLIVPIFFIFYKLNFDALVTKETLYAIFQSNSDETYEYLSNFVDPLYLVVGFGMVLLLALLLYRQERLIEVSYKKIGSLWFMIATFSLISYALFNHLHTVSLVSDACIAYQKELTLFKAMREKRAKGNRQVDANKTAQGETYLVIIGESLNRAYMGLYGYEEETTPLLNQMRDEQGLMVFDNLYSNHVHTMQVLSYALTQANQYNDKSYFRSLSIIDILNQANIETYWVTNQALYGGWDNMVSVLAHSAKHLIGLNHTIGKSTRTQSYDGAVIPEVKKILAQKSSKNRVIFVHLMGNHSTYTLRYPSTFERYKKHPKGKRIASYNNSVYYNDYVVASLMKLLDDNQSVAAAIYLSDHGEEVEKNYGHNIDRFTYEMTRIPMLIWLSDHYQARYPKIQANLMRREHRIFTNDLLYDTLIGLIGVETKAYEQKYDFTSDYYALEESKALLNHGERKVQAPDNYIYWKEKQ
jgi:glucan phosphoethanolaminetransferase (alkaline phosphatase superfamily)